MPQNVNFFFQVKALYDFEAQPDSGEISVSEGEILTVTRTDVGEGWYEGTNSRGQSGLFPEQYVEVCVLYDKEIQLLHQNRFN